MSNPLDGVHAKVDRSAELLDTLRSELTAFKDAKPEPYRVTYSLDQEHNVGTAIFHVDREPPLHLGVLVGDVIHNLRSALDHLVYQLAALNGSVIDKTGFPIYTDRSFLQ